MRFARKFRSPRSGWWLYAALSLGAGGAEVTLAAPAASTGEVVSRETELLRLTLTSEAETRLGLKTETVARGTTQLVRRMHGELLAPGAAGGLPVSSATDLAILGGNQARAEGEVARARAELASAERAYARAEELVKESAARRRRRSSPGIWSAGSHATDRAASSTSWQTR